MFLLDHCCLPQVPEVTQEVVTVFLASSKWHATGITYQSILGGHRPLVKWYAELGILLCTPYIVLGVAKFLVVDTISKGKYEGDYVSSIE